MKVHLIGIGGIGISALARYFLSEGWQVSGSDLSPSDTLTELKKEGVGVSVKHRATNIKQDVNLVIYNQAIPQDNPELIKARQLGIDCKSYPEAVGELTRQYKTIAVAGSHGKSTTTAMLSLILVEAGLDPTVIVGTKLKEFGGKNFRRGKSDWLVLEADEWKASFLNYYPTIAVITNIDKEHLDFYKNFSEVKKAFEKFKDQCEQVLPAESDPKIASEIKKVLKIPGQHNIQNALAAFAVAKYIGVPKSIILKALGKYTGAWRRMEFSGFLKIKNLKLPPRQTGRASPKMGGKIPVYDDYAHHPTEIRATLAAFREKWPKNALICVFQAHQAQRLKLLFNDFKTAFKDAGKVLILPTYEVAGREKAQSAKRKAQNNLPGKLADSIGAVYVENPEKDLKRILTLIAKPYTLNPVIVMMGAGDIVDLTKKLIKK